MGLEEHRAAGEDDYGFAIITVSDTRELATDRGGDTLVELALAAGHRVVLREIVRDEPDEIRAGLARSIATAGVDLVLYTGGTGIAARDVTVPTLEAELEGIIPGFGELFRALSFREIGSAAILSRATAGFLRRKVIFALPGSPKALRLAMNEIILKEAGHLVSQVRG